MAHIQQKPASGETQKMDKFRMETRQAADNKEITNSKQQELKNVRASKENTGGSDNEGSSWQFFFVLGLIGAGVLGLILKVFGLF